MLQILAVLDALIQMLEDRTEQRGPYGWSQVEITLGDNTKMRLTYSAWTALVVKFRIVRTEGRGLLEQLLARTKSPAIAGPDNTFNPQVTRLIELGLMRRSSVLLDEHDQIVTDPKIGTDPERKLSLRRAAWLDEDIARLIRTRSV